MTHPPDPYGNAARQRGEGMSDSPNPAYKLSTRESSSKSQWIATTLRHRGQGEYLQALLDVAEAAKKFERVHRDAMGSASPEVDGLLLDRAQENLREALDRLEQREEV